MKNFRRSIILLCFGLQALFSPTAGANEKIKVVASFTIIADIAREVAGEALIVESLTRPGVDIHNYQPTPQDIVRTQNAKLILSNGLNLEIWLERFLQDISDVPNIIVSEGIQPLSIYAGDYEGKPNPHAWLSTVNALIYVDNIKRAFIALDPEQTDIYQINATAYQEKILALQKKIEDQRLALVIPESQRYLATSEGAFSYLAQEMDLKEAFIWPINSDQQSTPQQMRTIIDLIREHQIPVIFSESTISDKPARQVARETGAHYGGVLYVDSLSTPEGPAPTYLALLEKTSTTILQGFVEGFKNTNHD